MITTREMRILEENAQEFGITKAMLMENAGRNFVKELRKRISLRGKKVLVLAYHGNNGGDGFVITRILRTREKTDTTLAFIGDEKKLSAEARQSLEKIPSRTRIIRKIEEAIEACRKERFHIIIDALLGTGAKGELKSPLKEAAGLINEHAKKHKNCKVVSVDIPTGVNPDTGEACREHVKADLIITFHDIKQGVKKFSEENPKTRLAVAKIGLPRGIEHHAGIGDLLECLPARKRESKKGDFGKILVVGGSEEFAGAPALAIAGISALRAGSDLVRIAAPEKVAWAVNAFTPDLISVKLKGDRISEGHLKQLLKEAEWADVILVGPGLGREKATERAIKSFLTKRIIAEKKKVIDADALKIISMREVENALLTPHRAEMKALWKNTLGKEWKSREMNRKKAEEVQKELRSNVLLVKGPEDYIISSTRWKKNKTGNPGMTVGGTGDVLAGLAAGFLGLGNGLFESACAAAWLAGKAGDECREELGYSFIASDVAKKAAELLGFLGAK